MQDIDDRCLLLMSSMSFVDLPFQEHRMMEKHHMDKNPCIVVDNMTRGDDVAQSPGPTEPKWGLPGPTSMAGRLGASAISISALPMCQGGSVHGVSDAQSWWRPSWVAGRPTRFW
jgi:hypothetical protein